MHADFPNSDDASNHSNPDLFVAKYTARRDKNDGNGFYSQMQAAFIKLQAAIAAGDDYEEERDEAIAVIKDVWEKATMATIINYGYSAISKLSATNPGEADQASALTHIAKPWAFCTAGTRSPIRTSASPMLKSKKCWP
ncbi:MAG: hypothetical protein R3B47_09490 [Bacteroidia bacterium]